MFSKRIFIIMKIIHWDARRLINLKQTDFSVDVKEAEELKKNKNTTPKFTELEA